MKQLALLVALLVVAVGIAGLVAPEPLFAAGRHVLTPVGLYVVAAVRVGMGVVLILAAGASRTPQTLKALGVVLVVAGLATPLFGVDRALDLADWAAVQGSSLVQWAGAALLVIGGFIAFTVAAGRRA